MRQFDDATPRSLRHQGTPSHSCPANPTCRCLCATLAISTLAVGTGWLATSFDTAGSARLLPAAASLGAVAWVAVKSLRSR